MRRALFLVAFAGAAASLEAQGGQPPPPDTTRRADTNAVAVVVRDSVKAPFTVGDGAVSRVLGRDFRWNRDELFESTALNVAELIALIPGARIVRSGFMLAPQTILWFGEPGRVRVFFDGIETDNMDPRAGFVQDLGTIELWNLEEVLAEATPSELRLHLRTWRVARTAAETRVDVLTGDAETNLYRGYYGKRFQSGLGFQFGFQQYSTSTPAAGGDGDALSILGRLGWARNALSVDVATQRDRRTRNATIRLDEPGSIPAFAGGTMLSYVRAALRSPDQEKPWIQLVASGTSFKEETAPHTDPGLPADSADTNRFRAQYLVTGGLARWGVKTSAAARYRVFADSAFFTPSVRASFDRRYVGVHAYVERETRDSMFRADVGLRVTAFPWLIFTANGSRRQPFASDTQPAKTFASGEASVRLGGLWFAGGVVSRPEVIAAAPLIYARGIAPATVPETVGKTFGAWGRLYKAVNIDVRGTLYDSAANYRPQNDFRARVWLDTEWRSQFPRGDFTLRISFLYEHFGGMVIPVDSAPVALDEASPMSTLLEIRIKSATITWQFRNILGTDYQTVPGYAMPARINLYGIRWNFSN